MLTATRFFGGERKAEYYGDISHDATSGMQREKERLSISIPLEKEKREILAKAIEKLILPTSWSGAIYQARDKMERVRRDEESINFIASMLRSGGGFAKRTQVEGALEFLSFYGKRFDRFEAGSTDKLTFVIMMHTAKWFLTIKAMLKSSLLGKMGEHRIKELEGILEVAKSNVEKLGNTLPEYHKYYGNGEDATWKENFGKSADKLILKLIGREFEPFTKKEIDTLFDVFGLVRLELALWKEDGHKEPSQTRPEDIDDVLSLIFYPPYRATEQL